MAGNSVFTGQDGNIYVDFDVQNLIVVDPNKIQETNGKVRERTVEHENLVMYANLETKLLPRTKLAVGATGIQNIDLVSIAEINFLKPGGQTYLTNDYTNEITGEGVFNRGTTNKTSASFNANTTQKPVSNLVSGDPKQKNDTGLLGITSINVKTDTSFVPQVTIELEDVQGRALFEKGDLSPYAAFFNLPYPPFYLTLKGFYGQAIRYQLNLISFNARFNTFSGNYQVTLQFYGYKFNILNEISIGNLFALPHMYESTYSVAQPIPNSNQYQTPVSYTMEGGMAKIQEVYKDYKQKGLIPQDFPELSLNSLLNRLEVFIQNLQSSWTQADVESITQSRNFAKTLVDYDKFVYSSPGASWFDNNCDKAKGIVTKKGKEIYYPLKKEFQDVSQQKIADLVKLIDQYNGQLDSNPVFGKSARNKDLHIPTTITKNTIVFEIGSTDIDYLETYKFRKKTTLTPDEGELALFRVQVEIEFLLKKEKQEGKSTETEKVNLFVFDGSDKFTGLINKMSQDLNSKSQAEEERLTALLAEKFEDKATGIGFVPTIRNVITVIMASAEGFIRLLDDVHKKAWDKRDDPDRKSAVLKYPSSDAKDLVVSRDGRNEIPIYPWPQYFQQDDKGERFVLVYPGDKAASNVTKAYLYEKWPEVEFVEEFFKGYTERGPEVRKTSEQDNEQQVVQRLSLNGIEFPQNNVPYASKEEVKFFFEIWERTYLNSFYNRFQRGGDDLEIYNIIGRNEAQNIVNALGISPSLITKLKNYGFNFQNFLGVLAHISNQGTGPSIQKLIRDIFATPYIQSEVDDSFKIYDKSTINPSASLVDRGLTDQDLKNFDSLIKLNVQPDLCDTYPFTDSNWRVANLEFSDNARQGLFYNTKKTLFVNQQHKVISNFLADTDALKIRPVTSFCYKNFTQPVVVQENFNLFYTNRTAPENFISTEGKTKGNGVNTPIDQTTSIMNTPYFVNAIQNGVDEWKNNNDYPFVQGAYLLLNSLPLETLRGTYKTDGEKDPLDYIASSLKRFGGVHKLPYPWILRVGSVYHRFKKYVADGVDILDSCWKDFDYVRNFDPVGNSVNKSYNLNFGPDYYNLNFLQTASTRGDSIDVITQGGFYPKLINDFNLFFNGKQAFTTYSDIEIQLFADQNLKVGQIESGSINTYFISGDSLTNSFVMVPWTVLLKNTLGTMYTMPSFGSKINQVSQSIFNSYSTEGVNYLERPMLYNPSIFNGTVRMFWAAPNFGYFSNDINLIRKPNYNEYMCYVSPEGVLSPMTLGLQYSSIEDIFSVFNKEQLELFEQKFLDFCKPVYNMETKVGQSEPTITLNVDTTDPDRYLKNFQLMVREFCEVQPQQNKTDQAFFTDSINQQFDNIVTILSNFMDYDIVFKFGNPSNYNRRLFDSFLPDQTLNYSFVDTSGTQTTTIPFKLVDPLKFNPYVIGSLPTSGGTTFLQSLSSNPEAWKELRLQVGESTIPKLAFNGPSSYITDFFIDNNIEFTANNVKTCAPLIKIYATQKLADENLNAQSFQKLIQNYSDEMIEYQKNVFNNLITYLQKNLPNIDTVPEKTIKSSVEGNMVKAQIYEMFKAINDKWIAGNAYNEETLLQDFLFVDRASRNVGDQITVDVYALKNKLKGLNLDASVYTLIGGLLTEHHFSVMPLPAYVNFYNIQTPDGLGTPKTENSSDFANNLWGTFLNVDYRMSQPKMVCFYSEKPSNYPDLGRNKDFRYKNDGFACNSLTDNPLLEDQKNKTDWSQSNRCVGFVVDMGLRNQNVFSSFSVSQDIGNATSESLIATNDLANQASGRQSVSQNVSLLNIYNERSYTCNVVSLGNALIQPTMYFCLNHVPMFNGAYLITEVQHTISPGVFQTTFTGVRQRVFSSVKPNNYLMSLNQNLLQKLPDLLRQPGSAPTTGTVTQTSDKTAAGQNSCDGSVLTKYKNLKFEVETANPSSISVLDFVKIIKNKLPASITDEKKKSQLAMMVYATAFIGSADSKGNTLTSYGSNYSNIDLQTDWGPTTSSLEKKYCCVNIGTDKSQQQSKPFNKFSSAEKLVEFVISRLTQPISIPIATETNISYIPTLNDMYNFYKTNWPTVRNETQQSDFEKNQGREVKTKMGLVIESIKVQFPQAGISITSSPAATQTVTSNNTPQQVNQNTTPDAYDRSAFTNAKLGVDTIFAVNTSVLNDGKLRVSGGISTTLTKEYNVDIYLLVFNGQGTKVKIGSTILGKDGRYSFTTPNNYTMELDAAADGNTNKDSRNVGISVVIREYPEYFYTIVEAVLDFPCPGESYRIYDLITPREYESILKDPCGDCYPNGTGGNTIVIKGKECT